jgi:hypothetical protein
MAFNYPFLGGPPLRSLKVRAPDRIHCDARSLPSNHSTWKQAMASLALDLVLRLTGVRGHIPRFDDFRPVPAAPTTSVSHVLRVVAITAAVFAALSLALWGTVWIAIQLF